MTTFNDLLKLPVERVINGFDYRMTSNYWNFFKDKKQYDRYDNAALEDQDRVKTHYIKSHSFDGTREWNLGYLMFDDKPVMFFYSYGRGGTDGYGNAIVNSVLLSELDSYINTLCEWEDYEIESVYSLSDDANWITKFYDQDLFDAFKTY